MQTKSLSIFEIIVSKVLPTVSLSLTILGLASVAYYGVMIHMNLILTGWSLLILIAFGMVTMQGFIFLSHNKISKTQEKIVYVIAGILTIAMLVWSVWISTNGQISSFVTLFMAENNGISAMDMWLSVIIYSLGLLPLLALSVKSAWDLVTNLCFDFED